MKTGNNGPTPKFKSNAMNVKIGTLIEFRRKGILYQGLVMMIREVSVIVKADLIIGEDDLTVVNHANYEIITTTPTKYITNIESFC
ncbi:DUF2187 family protein [Viridibacillus arvi]|uniref:DUF2187 family protein n=1 Tax=Viridibacillus arvi TaxID=263475 RepID=UPI0034CE536C